MTTVQRGAIFRANGNAHLIKMSSYTYLPYELTKPSIRYVGYD